MIFGFIHSCLVYLHYITIITTAYKIKKIVPSDSFSRLVYLHHVTIIATAYKIKKIVTPRYFIIVKITVL